MQNNENKIEKLEIKLDKTYKIRKWKAKEKKEFLNIIKTEDNLDRVQDVLVYNCIDGEAAFSTHEYGLHYREQLAGNLENGEKLTGYREYLYVFGARDLKIFFFADNKQGDLFLSIPLTKDRSNETLYGEAKHLCVEDNYQARFSFATTDSFSIEYDVRGPRKNYQMRTEYSPLPDPNGAI